MSHDALHLGMVFVACDQQGPALLTRPAGQAVDLGHKGAGGVMHHKAPGPKRIVHALRHAVAAHHHLVAVGHLFGCIHGNGAPGRKVRHALRIMDERPQRSHPHALLQQAVGELYRTVHSEAEARRLCLNDVHTLMIGAAGVGKTAYFLYPNIELACASGMSFISTDTKGDVARNYGTIASKYYGYNVSVLDLRNPTRSDENNILHLVNKYMDLYLEDKSNLSAKAKAEKYAKITAKTIINIGGGDSSNYGQNAFFYDAAEGLLASVILLLAEFGDKNERHIVSVFKLIQDLLAKYQPNPKAKPKMYFSKLMDKLPSEHKAKWLAGAALNSSDQSMLSVMSTALSRLNSFLDTEMEQMLCFGTAVDAEKFCNEKSAIFIVLPEEDTSKYFMVSLVMPG